MACDGRHRIINEFVWLDLSALAEAGMEHGQGISGQWEWGLPVPQRPQERGWPEHSGCALSPVVEEANTESFFARRVEPHLGHSVPSQFVERTSTSESRPHFSQ